MRNRVLTKFTYALLIIVYVLTVACSPTESYLPNEVDFRIARQQADQNYLDSLDSRFDDYSAVWISLVSLGLQDDSEKSFKDFVLSIHDSMQLTSQAVLAMGLLADQDLRSDNRISTPNSEEDATIGCRTAVVAARRSFGAAFANRLFPNGCHGPWIEFQVKKQLGDTSDNWINWLVKRTTRGYTS